MKKTLICLFLAVCLLAGCTVKDTVSEGGAVNTKYADTASSGVWLSFSEINSMLKSGDGFKAELSRAIENCKALKIGEIYVHIRSYCDSLFKSDYFPLISAAEGLDYDVFEYIVSACHSAGLKVHAWINPYRVLTSSDNPEDLSRESPAYKWLHDDDPENDKNVVIYNGIYLNPAEYEVRELVISGICEVLQKYDVDGIHFDDYFYPTTDPEFDLLSYEKYKSDTENPLELSDWRRSNVNALISGAYTAVKFYDKNILFTVSPMASVEKNYNELYADVSGWIKNGCVDCIIPQLYFGFNYPDPEFCFEGLLEKWTALAAENTEVELKIGLAPYKIGTDSEADCEEWNASFDILARQAKICRENGGVSGYVLFSYSSLFSENELNVKQRNNLTNFVNSCD
ncbi:MAG: glycoside hydrolase family 10 protein [Acutalibacteraceae bacterium]